MYDPGEVFIRALTPVWSVRIGGNMTVADLGDTNGAVLLRIHFKRLHAKKSGPVSPASFCIPGLLLDNDLGVWCIARH
jgi:hypothetical protein